VPGIREARAMLAEYTGVLVILTLSLALIAVVLGIHLRVGPRRVFPSKQEPFECGERPVTSPRRRIAVKFYVVAILFVLFDVEAIYFYPWGVAFRELGWFGFASILVFTLPLAVGLFYEWMKGGLDW
jgi:NADH-quinone oxidoreductase subunit A